VTVDQKLLARNEYLATENRILKDELKGRLMLSDAERATARLWSSLGSQGSRRGRNRLPAGVDKLIGHYARVLDWSLK
jgi:putative transposase